ncbi:MAG: lipoate--protein ligase [Bacilli bacterium]|nr:lipoate--protein ligase [Bacilli bacterium]
MYTIINNSNNPYYNLALEEYLLKSETVPQELVWLWQNRPAVIVGRNQNTIEEINHTMIKEKGIDVVRRISGGGAVYHDLGNINFTFITSARDGSADLFRQFTAPVIAALRTVGVPAEFSGRNDIIVNNKKISGNAQAYYRDRMVHHGTILFDADLETVGAVLNVSMDKISSKGVKSVRSRVDNIKPYLKAAITIEDFKKILLQYLIQNQDITARTYRLGAADKAAIRGLVNTKYRTREWNYGQSPAFEMVRSGRFTGGKITFHINVKGGKIVGCRIFGDFFGKKDIEDLAAALLGVAFFPQALSNALDGFPLDEYLFNINKNDIINCLFN